MENHHDMDTGYSDMQRSPWAAYDQMLRRAQAARAQFLYGTLLACLDRIRARVCSRMEKLRINICPLCCH